MNNHMQSVNWSDDDNSSDEENQIDSIGEQPNRDFPISDDENDEEEEYDMDSIIQLTLSKSNKWTDLFNKKEPDIKNIKPKINNSINNNIKNLSIYEKRKFNPRLPPPDKYKKNGLINEYKHNDNEFPIL